MNEKYQAVKNAITAAVPEIMELNKGCEVICRINGNDQNREATVFEKGEHIHDSFPGGGDHQQEYIPYETLVLHEPWSDCPRTLDTSDGAFIVEILGRPITFEDILFVLENRPPYDQGKWFMNHGDITVRFDSDYGQKGSFEWRAGKSLEWHAEHKPETIDFLYKILVTNN